MTDVKPEARQAAVAWVEEWVRRPALARLVEVFGGPRRGSHGTARWLSDLEDFSAIWDYRRGRERNLVTDPSFPSEVIREVLAAAEQLGLRGPDAPKSPSYDVVVILGGLVRASLARPAFAAQLIDRGTITASRVVALGGHRPLAGDEIEMAESLIGAHARDELDAMDAGIRSAFQLGRPAAVTGEQSDLVGGSWTVREYRGSNGLPIDVVAAPSTEPGIRRANTADTYAWLAKESGLVSRGDRALIITTRIYSPFQEADAWRMLRLPHGVLVEVVGIDPGEVDQRLAQRFAAHQYLQETRSAIRAMRLLLSAATDKTQQA